MAGCGDDTDDGDDDGVLEGDAFLVATRVRTPTERTVLLNVVDDLQVGELDQGQALELPGTSRAAVFEGRVYGFDGEGGDVIRYEVRADRSLRETGRFTMSGVGVVSFRTTFAFLTSTRAYYVDVPGEQVVVFDPSAMEIVSTFPAPEVAREGFDTVAGRVIPVSADEVVMPLSWTNQGTGAVEPVQALLVLSASSDEVLRVVEDDRCALTGGAFLDDDGFVYAVGDSGSGVFDLFGTTPLPPPCLLRYPPGGTGFAGDYLVDLREATGAPQFADLVGAGDGTFLTRAFDSDIDPDTLDDPRAYFRLEIWRFALGDVSGAAETTVVDGLPLSGISFGPFIVDGDYLVPVVDEEEGEATLYRLAGTAPFELLTATGEVQVVARIQ